MSEDWPLEALQAVLMSGIAHLFVRAYSTKMHGGTLRFQAQYLRRIRLPRWSELSVNDQQQLVAKLNVLDVVCHIYSLADNERSHLHDAAT